MKVDKDDTHVRISFQTNSDKRKYVNLFVAAARWYQSELYSALTALESAEWYRGDEYVNKALATGELKNPHDFYPAFLGKIDEITYIHWNTVPIEPYRYGGIKIMLFLNNGKIGCNMNFDYLRPSSRDIVDRADKKYKFIAYDLAVKAEHTEWVDKRNRAIYVTTERQLFSVDCLYCGDLYNGRFSDQVVEPELIS